MQGSFVEKIRKTNKREEPRAYDKKKDKKDDYRKERDRKRSYEG